MTNAVRDTRIQLRCTEHEASNIREIADTLNRPVSELVRDAITIAIASNPNESQWDRKLATAIMKIADRSPWTTS
jgi:hypothetical protein